MPAKDWSTYDNTTEYFRLLYPFGSIKSTKIFVFTFRRYFPTKSAIHLFQFPWFSCGFLSDCNPFLSQSWIPIAKCGRKFPSLNREQGEGATIIKSRARNSLSSLLPVISPCMSAVCCKCLHCAGKRSQNASQLHNYYNILFLIFFFRNIKYSLVAELQSNIRAARLES